MNANNSIAIIPELALSIPKRRLKDSSVLMDRITAAETEVHRELKRIVE